MGYQGNGKQQKEPDEVKVGSFVCEPALWLRWRYRGTMKARKPCFWLTFPVDAFHRWALQGKVLGLFATKYAVLYVQALAASKVPIAAMNDLWVDWSMSEHLLNEASKLMGHEGTGIGVHLRKNLDTHI